MTTVYTLASGSSGNALLVTDGAAHLLVDAGISCRRVTAALAEMGLSPAELTAILITHTHSDHISGMGTLLKRTGCPVYATARTGRGLAYRLAGIEDRFQPIELCQSFQIAGITAAAFPTSHDAPGSCGYRFDTADGAVGVLTDTGSVTPEAAEILPGVDLAVLEANHDEEMLLSGPYPYYLKERILGEEGHLSNAASARFAVALAEAGASELVLAHLSRENNTPAAARHAVETALSAAGLFPRLSVAPRDRPGGPHPVVRRALCKK